MPSWVLRRCASKWSILTQRTQNLKFVDLNCVTYAHPISVTLMHTAFTFLYVCFCFRLDLQLLFGLHSMVIQTSLLVWLRPMHHWISRMRYYLSSVPSYFITLFIVRQISLEEFHQHVVLAYAENILVIFRCIWPPESELEWCNCVHVERSEIWVKKYIFWSKTCFKHVSKLLNFFFLFRCVLIITF